ncbi:cupin domain-containing protein [Granulicella cerasi]|uniref:Cupin domain-containing protein n=1 Tax=Granulicella cerasi TaxID=741063 RepID=A0ABW1ZCU7_9BACT|nr:cupin domain-containing protein [Granulicella cerasi]
MKIAKVAAAVSLSAMSAGAVSAQTNAPNQGATGKRDILLQSQQSWNGKPYTTYPKGQPELTMIKLTIAPHSVLPWHSHPVPNAGYVLSGTLTLHDRASGKTHVVHQGETFAESVDDVHRGESGDVPTVLLITYAGVHGVPTSVPAKGEKPEY